MADIIGGVKITGFISPTDTLDTYPVIDPIYGIDGLRSLSGVTEMNNISTDRRREGMLVYLQDEKVYYKLLSPPWSGNIGDWEVFNVSSTGGTDTYWTSGSTGIYSIKANNDSGLDATNNYALAEGNNTLASGLISHAEGANTIASGQASHAEGNGTKATGDTSHAEGYETSAWGEYSHAENRNTLASGPNTHAEGYQTIASGSNSHAEGNQTIATGTTSHAEGDFTQAWGSNSHAEGASTTAVGPTSHAEGLSTKAIGENSHAEGSGTNAGWFGLLITEIDGNNVIISDDIDYSEYFGDGYVFIRDGFDVNYYFNYASISFSSPYFTITLNETPPTKSEYVGTKNTLGTSYFGNYTHSENNQTIAVGDNSHAGGYNTKAFGTNSFVHGNNSIAIGNNSIVLGLDITGSIDNTTYVDNLNIKTIGVGTLINNLGVDTDGNIVAGQNVFVTGFTFNPSNYNLTLSQNINGIYSSFTENLGILSSDMTITGGTYNPNNGRALFTNNSGGSFSVSGFLTGYTDTYVTGGTYNPSTGVLVLNRNSGISVPDITGFTSTFTGGTVSGPTRFTSGLTGNTISATTYQNLPVSGLTAGSNIGVTNSNGNHTISFTGGAVTSATNFTSSLSANTFSATSINITTTPTLNTGSTQTLVRNTSTGAINYKDTTDYISQMPANTIKANNLSTTSTSFDITRDSLAFMMANKTNVGGTGVLTGITTTNIQTIRLSASTILGIGSIANGVDGKTVRIFNDTTSAITVYNEYLTETILANRIYTGGQNIILSNLKFSEFTYDSNDSRWILSSIDGNTFIPSFSGTSTRAVTSDSNGLISATYSVVNPILSIQYSSGTAITSASKTSIWDLNLGSLIIPTGYINRLGGKIFAKHTHNLTTFSSPGNITFDLDWAATTLFSSSALSLTALTGSITGGTVETEVAVTTSTIGSSGVLVGYFKAAFFSSTGFIVNTYQKSFITTSNPNLTSDQILNLSITFSSGSVNSWVTREGHITLLN